MLTGPTISELLFVGAIRSRAGLHDCTALCYLPSVEMGGVAGRLTVPARYCT